MTMNLDLLLQTRYRRGKEDASSLYSALPETLDTLHAREASELQSQVASRLAAATAAHPSVSSF